MKRFLKHNLILVIVLGISLIAALGLLVWTAMEYIQMSRYMNETVRLRQDIATLIKKEPAPVAGNLDPIERDKQRYEKTAAEIRRHFGHPLQPALDGFVKVLRTTDDKELSLKEFKEEFYKNWSNDKTTADQGVDYKTFQRNFRNWPMAMDKFRQDASLLTAEPITDGNIDEIFLAAIGVPRKLDGKPDNLYRFMHEFRNRLMEICKDKVEFETPEAKNFSFSFPNSTTTGSVQVNYLPEDYPMITRNWEILGDIVKRSAGSGIKSFVSFRHRTIQPESNGSFHIFHFSIEVTGTLESVRNMVSLLDKAIFVNRVYIVRSVFLYQDHDDAETLVAPAALPGFENETPNGPVEPVQSGRRPRGRGRVEMQPQEMTREEMIRKAEEERKAEAEAQKNLPYNERTGYGKILAGGHDSCRAIIDVEYVMEANN